MTAREKCIYSEVSKYLMSTAIGDARYYIQLPFGCAEIELSVQDVAEYMKACYEIVEELHHLCEVERITVTEMERLNRQAQTMTALTGGDEKIAAGMAHVNEFHSDGIYASTKLEVMVNMILIVQGISPFENEWVVREFIVKNAIAQTAHMVLHNKLLGQDCLIDEIWYLLQCQLFYQAAREEMLSGND